MKCQPKKVISIFSQKPSISTSPDQREVIQFALFRQRDRAAKNIRLEAHISIRKKQPLAGRSLIRFLQRVRFAEPAGREFRNVDSAKTRMRCGELIENAARRILRTVIHANNFQMSDSRAAARVASAAGSFSSSSRAAKRSEMRGTFRVLSRFEIFEPGEI